MINGNKTSEIHNIINFYLFQKRPENLSDLDILWAIRDIPRSILSADRKGILSMFLALIGNKKSFKCDMKRLEDALGLSGRRLRDHFHYLEEINFLIIERPRNYVKGLVNEYGLNYEKILSTAREFSRDKN